MAVNHGTSSMQIRVTGAFIRPIKSPIKPSSVREDGLLPLDPPLWVAQPPTEDKSSTRIPPRGCREFSLPDSYPETQRNRSTYCLELIFAHPPLFSHLSSFVETSTLIPANFLLTFHFLFFLLLPPLPLPLPLSFSKSFGLFSVEARTCPLETLGFREREKGGGWIFVVAR